MNKTPNGSKYSAVVELVRINGASPPLKDHVESIVFNNDSLQTIYSPEVANEGQLIRSESATLLAFA
jgi:hypothetical protein